jgi:hypothetical protein
MLLTEPGSRVDGPTEDVLRALFYSVWKGAADLTDMDIQSADTFALRLLPRLHETLMEHGYVVRDLAVPDPRGRHD